MATAPIQPLAWEPPYAAGAAQRISKKRKGKKKRAFRKHSPPSVSPGNWFQESPHKVGPGLGFPAGGGHAGAGTEAGLHRTVYSVTQVDEDRPRQRVLIYRESRVPPGKQGHHHRKSGSLEGRRWAKQSSPPSCMSWSSAESRTCITWLLGVRWENLFLYPLLS